MSIPSPIMEWTYCLTARLFPPRPRAVKCRRGSIRSIDVRRRLCSCLSAFEDFDNRIDCIPIACGGRDAEELLHLTEIADRPHVTFVNAKHESAVGGEDS